MNQEQLAKRYIDIWIEVMGRSPASAERVSKMEQALFMDFLAGRQSEADIRSLLAKVKLFNQR